MNIQKLMKQAQQAQAQMAAVQEELANETVETSAGGGMVKVVMTCDRNLQEIKIDPAAVDPEEVELLEDMILAAITEATRTAEATASAKMDEVTGGMNIPGL
ncbi:MAG: YbaB/EbfC family nucleoid-associated protein [Coriobacteriia bacterium]|nr:YbaB/EbfC family nucleoid-associated protein [Coriobacteriia bacterium]MCL2746349.1 YbaB/EbfC family nucleoid-associated protein [Coriobacteriia bacterium]MCL2871006.1 YbaB/EbfC family nucleoid-associated protein [Coriobacteriia bacterium]